MMRQLTDEEVETRDDALKRRHEENQLLELGDRVGRYLYNLKKTKWCQWTETWTTCHLTIRDVLDLLDEANITIDDVGVGQYVLGRHMDMGDYTKGNCRFITSSENGRERGRVNRFASLVREKMERENSI